MENNKDNNVQPVSTPEPVAPQQPQAPQGYDQQAYPQQQVQYVVMQQSLKGIAGWLIFFLICFGIASLGYIVAFFSSMLSLPSALAIIGLIFSPLLAAGYIASIILISMQKKLGRLAVWITLGVSAVYSAINSIIAYITASNAVSSYSSYYSSYSSSYSSGYTARTLPIVIGVILASIVAHGLIMLYFFMSKRVKETLVN